MKPEDYQIKILVDQCLPVNVAAELRKRGFPNAVHILDTDLRHARDCDVLNFTKESDYFVVTSDRRLHKTLGRYAGGRSVYVEDTAPYGQRYNDITIAKKVEQQLEVKLKSLRKAKSAGH